MPRRPALPSPGGEADHEHPNPNTEHSQMQSLGRRTTEGTGLRQEGWRRWAGFGLRDSRGPGRACERFTGQMPAGLIKDKSGRWMRDLQPVMQKESGREVAEKSGSPRCLSETVSACLVGGA